MPNRTPSSKLWFTASGATAGGLFCSRGFPPYLVGSTTTAWRQSTCPSSRTISLRVARGPCPSSCSTRMPVSFWHCQSSLDGTVPLRLGIRSRARCISLDFSDPLCNLSVRYLHPRFSLVFYHLSRETYRDNFSLYDALSPVFASLFKSVPESGAMRSGGVSPASLFQVTSSQITE